MKRIKKIAIFLFFIILVIPFTANRVYAADCSDVMDAVNTLDEIDVTYRNLGCDEAITDRQLYQCNTVLIRKAATLAKIFEYNDDAVCPSIDLSSIISDYENKCTNRFSSKMKVVTDTLLKFFYIVAPFIIIIFGSLDFFKIITGNNPNEIKKHRTNFIKRLVAFLLIYMTPFLVERLFSITPYNINGTNYVCAEEISLMPKRTTATKMTGKYGGNNYGGSGDGQGIVDAAVEIKEYIIEHEYTYSYATNWGVPGSEIATDQHRTKTMCCATLIRPALYRAGIYTDEEANEIGINSETAGAVIQGLHDAGWQVIWDADDLQPGDVLAYHTPGSNHYSTYIEGELYHVGHVDIYAGDGQKISTGNPYGFANDNVYGGFTTEPDDNGQRFLCGLRYTGK